MSEAIKNVALLGSTGSIGTAALEVIAALGEKLRPYALAAHRNVQQLLQQAEEVSPRYVALGDPEAASTIDTASLPSGTQLVTGDDAVEKLAADEAVDIVLDMKTLT